jgi:hypothetical protein
MTCSRCHSDIPANAAYCPFCGADVDAPVERPTAPSAPVPVPAVRMSVSEARDLEAAREAVKEARRTVDPADAVLVLRTVRALLGPAYHHPAVCRAMDAAMEEGR